MPQSQLCLSRRLTATAPVSHWPGFFKAADRHRAVSRGNPASFHRPRNPPSSAVTAPRCRKTFSLTLFSRTHAPAISKSISDRSASPSSAPPLNGTPQQLQSRFLRTSPRLRHTRRSRRPTLRQAFFSPNKARSTLSWLATLLAAFHTRLEKSSRGWRQPTKEDRQTRSAQTSA